MTEKVPRNRKALGWPLKGLPSKVNIGLTELQRNETGAVSPSADLLIRIASWLQQPVFSYLPHSWRFYAHQGTG